MNSLGLCRRNEWGTALHITAVTTTLPLLIEKLLWSLNAFAHSLVFSVCQRSLFVVRKRSAVKNACKSVRPPSIMVFWFGGLTHFAQKLIARNHQQKTLVVARTIAFAHRKFPAHGDCHFVVRKSAALLPHTLCAMLANEQLKGVP